MAVKPDILDRAFGSEGWQTSAKALFRATGLGLFVFDLETERTVFSAGRCGYCHLSLDAIEPGPGQCYDTLPPPDAPACHVPCRGGLVTYLAPVYHDGALVAHVVLSGVVSSTRDRRRLYERLIGRGVREETARLAVRGMPLMPRGQIESVADLAASNAQLTLAAARSGAAAERSAAADAGPAEGRPHDDAVDAVLDTGIGVATNAADSLGTPSRLLDGALHLFGAKAGTIALKRLSGYVEVVAASGDGVRERGTKLRLEGGAAARALDEGRTVVVAGARSGRATGGTVVVAPLVTGSTPIGTLEIRFPDGRSPGAALVSRIERFARFSALAIVNAETRAGDARSLADLGIAERLARDLGSRTDAAQITDRVFDALCEGALAFDVAGLVVTSWGRDRADVVLAGTATAEEVSLLLGEACGRDVAEQPFDAVTFREQGGAVVEDGANRENWAFMSTPLATGDHTAGFLFCASARGVRYSAQDHRLLEDVARHAAIALQRAALFLHIRDDFAKTVAALSSSLDAAGNASRGHSARVMEYAMLIGEEMDLPLEDIEQLRFAGLLHDVGMTGVTEEILLSPVPLSAEELQRVRMHAELGATVVEQIEFLKNVTPVVLHHHERWDGSGFPAGLAGEAIPLLARILAVADTFDLMTSGTQRRARVPFSVARLELEGKSGSQFDPQVAAALLRALDRQALAGASGLLAPAGSKGRQDLPA